MRFSHSAIAPLILDAAGWHSSPIVLLPLPPYAPELTIWEYLRGNALSNRVWGT